MWWSYQNCPPPPPSTQGLEHRPHQKWSRRQWREGKNGSKGVTDAVGPVAGQTERQAQKREKQTETQKSEVQTRTTQTVQKVLGGLRFVYKRESGRNVVLRCTVRWEYAWLFFVSSQLKATRKCLRGVDHCGGVQVEERSQSSGRRALADEGARSQNLTAPRVKNKKIPALPLAKPCLLSGWI